MRRPSPANLLLLLAMCLAILVPGRHASAQTNQLPADINRLEVYPARVELQSVGLNSRVLVSAIGESERATDATRLATFESSNSDIVTVDQGVIVAVAPGEADIRVTVAGKSAAIHVVVGAKAASPVSLRNEVIPVLSRQGCSSGACHGSPKGKGGFRLSLRGFDLSIDETTLRGEFFARRVSVLDPDASLLLRKPLMQVPHAGGQRLRSDSVSHRVLRNWIGQGRQTDSDVAPRCVNLKLYPPSGRRLTRQAPHQQFVALADFSDGSTRDVTDLAVFTVSDEAVATVSADGLVSRADEKARGQAAVTVRYLEQMETSFLTAVPETDGFIWPTLDETNYVDELVHARLKQLEYVPAEQTSDSEFLRRVHLDVAGLLPSVETTQKFLADTSVDKRSRRINELLASSEHAKFQTLQWGDTLRIRNASISSPGVFKFYRWLIRSFEQNMPYDQFARELLTASGSSFENPPVNYFRTASNTNDCTESTAQIFLGARLECAKCHNHPHEKWTQDNYYGLAAFFNRIQRDTTLRKDEMFISVAAKGEVTQPRTGKQMKPWLPGFGDVDIDEGTDRRFMLAEWLTSPENDLFAKVEVNRLWRSVMGKGIVDPADDFRASNPPSNAELLDALAADFVKHKFDRRHILRVILNSQTYQRGSKVSSQNDGDDRYFSKYTRRLLTAEQLLDAVCDVTEVPESFSGLPAGTRATQLPSPDFGKEFLKVFGQPERTSVCQCERSDDLNLSQALQIANGSFVHDKLTNGGSRLRRLLREKKSTSEIIDECYLAAFSRRPTEAESATAVRFIESPGERPIESKLEDFNWALLNSNEFLFQH
ncbi:MAG: hypothetical protein ACI92S_000847 [Planctomycetaceae bacterium]|jgi:hypothetical protein